MEIKLITFGKITSITGRDVLVKDVADTDSLRTVLEANFPALKDTEFLIAVNREIIGENKTLGPGSEVALLPPFSGG
ncbi:MAG: MoaD/ThiS family protein [Chitinophagaceae bacterium]|nr:MAG: MoaD/ThiS family protein [Chitinophagaceae bacterium]